MLFFFYAYLGNVGLEFSLTSGLIDHASPAYRVSFHVTHA